MTDKPYLWRFRTTLPTGEQVDRLYIPDGTLLPHGPDGEATIVTWEQ